ncbi:hypothetical protein QAA18_09880 [Luteimonas sp. 8-5]|jgi:hypothetical protein|uniref:hypothetical protein n=1 Tax=Luteimonas sp. 8-5 TaxID=3039387 RepID=UPI0024367DFD|nr:hypothetical protein [Luteimonas sp. 8-5]MDG6349042.1 hypothetical protein [Luteimonas sp. 8-5]
MAIRYHITLRNPDTARGDDPAFAFRSHGAKALAEELQDALRGDTLFQRWRGAQEDPDDVDPALGAKDPAATVEGSQHDLHIDLIAVTNIPGGVLRHRLRLLAGNGWELRDVSAA